MSTEVKVYLDDEMIEENLCFHATVYSQTDYDVYYDLNDTYELLLVKSLKGDLEISYLDTDTLNKSTFSIDGDDVEENLHNFKNFLEEYYGLTVELENFELYSHIGVRLVGPGYREGENAPMLEHLQFGARQSLHGLRTSLFTSAVNNTDYNGDDIYINKASGSLILTLDATKRYEEPIRFMQEVYKDIKNKTIDPFKFQELNERERYQSIIRHLSELASQKRLKELYLIIDGVEYQIESLGYLKHIAKAIYNEKKELVGVYEGYKKGSDSFEIRLEKEGKYYCHLSKLSKEDNESYNKILKILSGINIFQKTVKIKVIGTRIKPKTIDVESVEML